MSDSPLDGGSGWPTSAYAIVPRQPAPPTQETRPEDPVAAEPAPEPQATTPPSRRGRVAILLIGLLVLIVAAVGGVLATRDTSSGVNDAGPAGQPATGGAPALDTPTVDAQSTTTNAQASTGTSGTPDPSASATNAATPQSLPTDVLRAGTVRLTVLAGQPDEMFDFDSGTKQASGADVAAGAIGLTAQGGAAFAPWSAPEAPTLAGCSAIPAAQWSDRVLLGALLPGAKVCVRTGEQRIGWFTPRSGDAAVGGQLYSTYLDFTVWRKTGD